MGASAIEPVWDVAVVGAGPAGASVALSALHACPAARVLLLDREDFPRDKACGDGIAPHVMDVLSSVGITGIEAGYAGVDRLQIGFASGPRVCGVMARPAYVIPREVFDARLVHAAVERGAQFRRHRVRTVSSADKAGPLILDGAIRARVVVAADGAYSTIRRQLAPPRLRASNSVRNFLWRFTSKPPNLEADSPLAWRFTSKPPGGGWGTAQTAVAIRGYAPVRDDRAGEQVIVFADPKSSGGATWPAYAWSFPIGDGRANVGYGELLRPGRPLTRQHLLDRLEALLPGATSDAGDWRAHHLPLSTGRPRQPDGPVLFVGDAMNLINPVTGEGIFYAVTSGVLAGQAAISTGRGRGASSGCGGVNGTQHCSDPGRTYRLLLRRAMAMHLRHTDAAEQLARWPAVVSAALRAADRRPGTFDDLVELGLGDGKLTLSTLGGIAASLHR